MKRLFAALAASVMMLGGAIAASAEALIPDEYYNASQWAPERMKPRLVDDADILTDKEEEDLLNRLDRISEKYEVDVVLLTVYSLGDRTPTEFADDYFAYNGFGQYDTKDGFMFMISMEERDWAICTHGAGIDILTDYGQGVMFDRMRSDLANDEFYNAFDRYVNLSELFIKEWQKGTPYDVDHRFKGPLSPIWLLIAPLGGTLIALIYCQTVKSQLTSVKMQRGADSYIRPNSFRITGSRDTFLYSKERRRRIESDSGGSGGGSSTHSHSSGSSFGGSSGKF